MASTNLVSSRPMCDMNYLARLNMSHAEFIPNSADILGEETTVLDGAKITITLTRDKTSGFYTEPEGARYDTTLGASPVSDEIIYHYHLEDGTCVSTALYHTDETVRQLYPEPKLFESRIAWGVETRFHYGNAKEIRIHTDGQLKSDYIRAKQNNHCKNITEATILAKQLYDEGVTNEEVVHGIKTVFEPTEEELESILKWMKLSDEDFFGDDDKSSLLWVEEAKFQSKIFRPSYPGCFVRNVVKNTLWDVKNIPNVTAAVKLAFTITDGRDSFPRVYI